MKTKQWFLLSVVGAWLICSSVQAQQPMTASPFPPPAPIPLNGDAEPDNPNPVPYLSGLSDWIQNRRPCCEGPLGKYTPLYVEVYLRAGPSVPIGGQTLSRQLETGWSIIGGARSLFFNSTLTAAWTIDPHIISTTEDGINNGTKFPLVVISGNTKTTFGANGIPGATVKSSNRTMAGLGFGREWYLWNPADSPDRKWRVGADLGGRWGSQKLELNETAHHLTDVIAGFYVAVHTDIEIPARFVIFYTGFRLEWAQTYSDILQQNSNVMDLSALLSAGIRF